MCTALTDCTDVLEPYVVTAMGFSSTQSINGVPLKVCSPTCSTGFFQVDADNCEWGETCADAWKLISGFYSCEPCAGLGYGLLTNNLCILATDCINIMGLNTLY